MEIFIKFHQKLRKKLKLDNNIMIFKFKKLVIKNNDKINNNFPKLYDCNIYSMIGKFSIFSAKKNCDRPHNICETTLPNNCANFKILAIFFF